MLTDEEKSKIKEEETYREELRRSSDPQKPKSIMTFLNSGLGLWFLSTIVIGLFTFSFNEYRENKKAAAERENKIKHLDLEIESRISQFWVNLDPLINDKDTIAFPLKPNVKFDTVKVLWYAFKNPPSSNPKLVTTIYKEYEARTTISLMIELSALLQEKYGINTASETNDAKPTKVKNPENYKEIEKIQEVAAFTSGDNVIELEGMQPPTVKRIRRYFDERIIIHRWSTLFPYTDCLC